MVISFSKLGNAGRTGNQFFQIAATSALAEKNKGIAIFPPWTYQFAFENTLKTGEFPTEVYKEPSFEYNEINIERDIDLLGYFQSEKYFKDHEDLIRKQFKFKPSFISEAKTGLEKAFEKETIAIHIRRGDYLQEPYINLYYQLPVTWFMNALFTIKNWKEKNIIIFSDDIEYAKFHFGCLDNAFFSEGKSDIQDVCLISLCDEQIISNSTFAWWGAWLGTQKNVMHSGKLFAGEFLSKDIKDFYPKSWNEYWPESLGLDLSDITFLIPVFCDHKDRRQNLDLCVCVLQSYFKTNIIVGEQGSDRFSYHRQWGEYIKFPYERFHRTKMLNEMTRAAKTPFVANWDCDVVIAPLQVYLSVDQLKNGSDMVFPYDGRFARLPRDPWFKKIEKSIDLGVLKDAPIEGKRGRKVPETSVGGAVFFNKESFIDGGMENEFMVSFGPEDCERNDRFEKLGYKITRGAGPLFHIDHFIGIDSSVRNPYFKANHVELEKGRKMSKAQLRGYVNSWPWIGKSNSEFKPERFYQMKAVTTIDKKEVVLYDEEIADELSKVYKERNNALTCKTIIHVKK